MGEKIADERVTLFTDPSDPGDISAQPSDGDQRLPMGNAAWRV